MCKGLTRRDWLALSGLAAGAMAVRPSVARPAEGARTIPENPAAPAEPVSVAKVRNYNEDLTTQFRKMFDQIGGIENQVKGKTVGHQSQSDRRRPFPGIHGGRHALGAPSRRGRGGRGVWSARRKAHPHS